MDVKSGAAQARGKLRGVARDNLRLTELAISAVAGFGLAGARIFGGVSPFGVAFCAALPGLSAVAAALGAALFYIVAPSGSFGMKYIAAVALAAAAKWLFAPGRIPLPMKPHSNSANASSVLSVGAAFFAAIISGAAVAFSSGYTIYDLILSLSEIMLTCGAAYFFSRSVGALRVGLGGAGKTDFSCMVISLAIVVMGLSGVLIQGVSLGHTLAAAAVLFAARAKGEAGGCVGGAVAGLAVSLAGAELGYAAAAYVFGGLVAGVFSRAGRLATAASFIAVHAVVAFLSLESTALDHALFEVCAASVIFALTPGELFGRNPAAYSGAAGQGADDGYIRGLLRDRLDDVSQALAEVGRTTRKVNEGLERLSGDYTAECAARAVERVCRKCAMRNTCWQFSYAETMEALTLALSTIKRSGGISRSRAPKYLTENCQKLGELLTELNLQCRAQGARSGAERKVALVRGVITDQFEALSLMMGEIAEDIYAFRAYDEAASRRVRDYLEHEGFAATRVRVFTDTNERLCVSFMLPSHQVARLSRAKSALDLCGLLDSELEMPQIVARGRSAAVSYAEKTGYAVQIGVFQLAEGQNRLCGDSYDFIENKDGKAHLILSDGMGSGGNAAVDSSMAAELTRQLLAAGVSHGTALKLANAALMVKASSESLATLDIATLDLFSGRADFYKAGAAPTFIVKGGKTGSIETSSIPAGILRGVSFEHSPLSLEPGDMVIMVSDGVTSSGSDWVKTELSAMRDEDIQELCEKLARAAKSNRADNHDDDITVLGARLVARQ